MAGYFPKCFKKQPYYKDRDGQKNHIKNDYEYLIQAK